MTHSKWLCGFTAMAFLFTASITSHAYGQNQPKAKAVKQIIANPSGLVSLGPQPEPPDRNARQVKKSKGQLTSHDAVTINPQPEPPGKARSRMER